MHMQTREMNTREQIAHECWPLRSDSAWHGFKNIDNEHMYLDPIKVTILTPGMKKDGTM
ncbi:hypothetical protein ONJ17_26475, partial [Salmonella enterica subsp. enterica serovar Agona]|nr:hypothetical protein [Salmonella enterica subsp. enterica serovar Agona]